MLSEIGLQGLCHTYIHTNFIQDVNKLIYRKNIILKDILKKELRGYPYISTLF